MYYQFSARLDELSAVMNAKISSPMAEVIGLVNHGGDAGNPRICVIVQDPGSEFVKDKLGAHALNQKRVPDGDRSEHQDRTSL